MTHLFKQSTYLPQQTRQEMLNPGCGNQPFSCVLPRLWDIECGACLRVLEGHEELVRCIRFDNKRIVSGAYDG